MCPTASSPPSERGGVWGVVAAGVLAAQLAHLLWAPAAPQRAACHPPHGCVSQPGPPEQWCVACRAQPVRPATPWEQGLARLAPPPPVLTPATPCRAQLQRGELHTEEPVLPVQARGQPLLPAAGVPASECPCPRPRLPQPACTKLPAGGRLWVRTGRPAASQPALLRDDVGRHTRVLLLRPQA